MKNIYVITLEEALKVLKEKNEKYAIIYLFKDERNRDLPFKLPRWTYKPDTLFYDLANIPISNEFNLGNWQAECIIQLCERCFDINYIYIVHNNFFEIAMNIADELAICYHLSFEFNDIPYNKSVRTSIRTKYIQITSNLLHTMKPMDYCKRILKMMFEQIIESISNDGDNYAEGFFFDGRQCTIMLKSGIQLHYHLETFIDNVFIPNIDEIEYVQFYHSVPVIDAFSKSDNNYDQFYYNNHINHNICGIINYYGNDFGYNSINGITRGETPIPEKYKDYRMIQREYWEFYKKSASTHIYPKFKDAYHGVVKAEKFLKESNGYIPRFSVLPYKQIKNILRHKGLNINDHFNLFKYLLQIMKENKICKCNTEFEKTRLYAAFLYTQSLVFCGHCENMTVVPLFFKKQYKNLYELPRFEKFWNIGKYVPSTDADFINQLCLAAYALIETVRPYNGRHIPEGTFEKCLEKIYSLTEGRHKLDIAVILTGAFAGAYCQPD